MQRRHDPDTQPSILDLLATDFGEPRRSSRKRSPQEEFEEFHERNPHVYLALRARSLEAVRAGKKIGIRCIWEVMRWDLTFTTTGSEFKLNDHYTARYARLLMAREPELAGYFEIRERSGKGGSR